MKFIKLMPEYGANPIWDIDGVMMSWADSGLSDHVINLLAVWNSNCCSADMNDPDGTLNARGNRLAQYIKDELHEHDVVYTFDGTEYTYVQKGIPLYRVVTHEENWIEP